MKKLLCLLPLFLLIGCASTISYKLDKNNFQWDNTNKVIAIGNLEDQRPDLEHKGDKGVFVSTYRSGDKDFKPNILLQIRQMLAKHAEQSGLFRQVLVKDLKKDFYSNPDEVKQLLDQGVDIAIVGNLSHFYAYQDMPNAGLSMFGLVGALTDMAINKKNVGGQVEYSEVEIVDLKTTLVLWKGNIEYHFEDRVNAPESNAYYWTKALRETNNRFVQKMHDVI